MRFVSLISSLVGVCYSSELVFKGTNSNCSLYMNETLGAIQSDCNVLFPGSPSSNSGVSEVLQNLTNKVDRMLNYGFDVIGNSAVKNRPGRDRNQYTHAVRPTDVTMEKRASLFTYLGSAGNGGHVTITSFDLFFIDNNLGAIVELHAGFYSDSSFRYKRWYVKTGSGDTGDDRCANVAVQVLDDHGSFGGTPTISCGGTPIHNGGGDRSGARRIQLTIDADYPGGSTAEVVVRSISHEAYPIDRFWIMAPTAHVQSCIDGASNYVDANEINPCIEQWYNQCETGVGFSNGAKFESCYTRNQASTYTVPGITHIDY